MLHAGTGSHVGRRRHGRPPAAACRFNRRKALLPGRQSGLPAAPQDLFQRLEKHGHEQGTNRPGPGKTGIDGKRRGETLSLQEFADIANAWSEIIRG